MPAPAPCDHALVWFRRDLRIDDHHALSQALQAAREVHCAFVFDRDILDALPRTDRRVEFIRESLVELDEALRQRSGHAAGGLITRHGWAVQDIPALARKLGVQAVFTNHDDEPQALARDAQVRTALAAQGIALYTFKDHSIFERTEVLSLGGTPYSVFTPYKNAWLKKLTPADLAPHPTDLAANTSNTANTDLRGRFAPRPKALATPVPTLGEMGFEPTHLRQVGITPGARAAQALFDDFCTRIDRYGEARDFPAIKGPSYLSVHLRFGTLSIRRLAAFAHQRMQAGSEGARVWLSELIWRDFYFQILANFPDVAAADGSTHSFRAEYDRIAWDTGPDAKALLAAWCEGRTGYPIVDAAMRQLNQTGYMHNRLRMVVASFLTKDLGLDWRWGERYFAQQLNDFDLSANNGGWQWASSSGCDAQPYFRIFNPVSQSQKFDPQGKFIRRYVPELAALPDAALHAPWAAKPIDLQAAGIALGRDYPLPVVDHAQAREKTLARYAVVKKAADKDSSSV
ncbi:MAG: cryptochrome/photolyase family protein [Burkholderiaceae bacterium]